MQKKKTFLHQKPILMGVEISFFALKLPVFFSDILQYHNDTKLSKS